MNKTLIGKNDILFLINDISKELEVHCNNFNLIKDETLSRYRFNNYYLFVYPDKSLIYKDFLPDEYIFKYRNALEIYKNKFKNKLFDLYEILKDESDIYYKTDTHINVKGNYIVYRYFIKQLNKILNINITPINLDLQVISCELSKLPHGLGDLTQEHNLGQQILNNKFDCFYFNDKIFFYNIYIIKNNNEIRFLNYNLVDETILLEDKICNWFIISDYIIYKKNENKLPYKVIIYYDSFLLNIISLFFDLFNELYLIKNIYDNNIINLINPDYIFEFRIERFLL